MADRQRQYPQDDASRIAAEAGKAFDAAFPRVKKAIDEEKKDPAYAKEVAGLIAAARVAMAKRVPQSIFQYDQYGNVGD